jgi:hypothetical protein
LPSISETGSKTLNRVIPNDGFAQLRGGVDSGDHLLAGARGRVPARELVRLECVRRADDDPP